MARLNCTSRHEVFVSTRRSNDLQAARPDDEEPRVLRASFHEDFAFLDASDVTVRGCSLDLFRLQFREHTLGSRSHARQLDWRIGIRHA